MFPHRSVAIRALLPFVIFTLAVSIHAVAQTPVSSQIAAGHEHTLLVKPDGTVWAFGANSSGQLGDNTVTIRRVPQQVIGLANVVAVAAGTAHSLALTSGGTVFAWGGNSFGAVGDGTTTQRKTPVALSLTSVVAIAAGDHHSLALRSNGEVYVWGRNQAGQIGNGTSTNVISPWLLTTGAQAIGAGGQHTLVVKTDGLVWGTGSNSYGQLADGSTTGRTALVQASGLTGVVAASGGADHSVFLLSDGTVMAAGRNSAGQVGDATTTQRTTAVLVTNLTGITAIEAGANHALAAAADGSLYSWGDNSQGGLGDGTATDRLTPIAVGSVGEVAAFAAGNGFSLAFTPMHYVWVAGRNNSSQLGDGATTDVWEPVSISAGDFSWKVATPTFSVAPGTYTTDRTVVVSVVTAGATIRYTQNGAEPVETDPVIASGGSIVVNQTQTLRARAWKTSVPTGNTGSAAYTMQVAQPTISPAGGTYTSARTVTLSTATPGATLRYTLDGADPTPASPAYTSALTVGTTTTVKAVGFKTNWSDSAVRAVTYTMNFGTLTAPAIAPAGGTYTGAVTVTLTADAPATIRYTLDGSTPSVNSPLYGGPFAVTNTATLRARSFHADYTASATTAQTFTLIAATPTFSLPSGEYAPGTSVTISGDAGSTLRWTLDGSDPTATSPVLPADPLLLGPYTIKVRAFRSTASDSAVASATYALTAPLGAGAVSMGDEHALLATPEGLLYAWGRNNNAQVGDGSATHRSTPVLVPTLTGVVAVAAGDMHSLAVTADGAAWGWGYNFVGAVGDGTTSGTRSRPVRVVGVSSAVAVAAGYAHSLLLTASGDVYAFGQGSSGQLGQNSTTSSGTPLLVPGLASIVAIAAGANHNLAVSAAGQVWAWGANGDSQVGDGTTTPRLVPTLVPGLTDVVAVAAGSSHSLARTRNGALWVWGNGGSGRLGLGHQTAQSTPVLVPNLTGAVFDAGASHSALLGSDGTLRSWGLNNQGQVGLGSTGQALSPTPSVGLPAGLTALSLGGATSVAVAVDGGVWTWGVGGPQLGDGTTAMRTAPALAWTAPGRWSPPPPMLSLGSGTYHTEQVALITSAVPGATVRYTTTGMDPTEADPEIPASGDVLIAATTTLKARAWVPDRAPSAVATAVYVFQPVAPSVTPPTGSYPGPQTVTITSADPLAVIRYTLDGSMPTIASPVYGGSFSVASTTTVQARAFRDLWTASDSSTATLTLTQGTLTTPTAMPSTGAYQPSQSIALTGPAGATIRYTTDGSNPTPASSIYTVPLTLADGTVTLKAKAFHPDWTESATLTETYALDGTPPTVRLETTPPAVNGWFSGPVTVSFVCRDAVGIASCPSSVIVSAEGETVVSGTAVDLVGNETPASLTVHIDLTPPTVTLSAPSLNVITASAEIEMAGTVSDALSGLAVVECNGEAAVVDQGLATCTVPLHPGRNSVVLLAQDQSGLVSSRGVNVIRSGTSTTLTLAPAMRTLLVEEEAELSLVDNFGMTIGLAAWNSSDSTVVALSMSDPPQLKALAPGTATITAAKDGMSATATITVTAGASLPDGTTRWSLPATAASVQASVIYAHRVDASVPDLFRVEAVEDGLGPTAYTVGGATADGQLLWTEVAPGPPIFADAFGGLVSLTEPSHATGLARFAGPSGSAPWRYRSPGFLRTATTSTNVAQGPDGTIFAIEEIWYSTGSNAYDLFVAVIDGASGQLKRRIVLPRHIFDDTALEGCYGLGEVHYWPPDITQMVVDGQGRGQLQVSTVRWSRSGAGCGDMYGVSEVYDAELKLLTVDPTGPESWTTVWDYHAQRPFASGVLPYASALESAPDGVGGMLVHWSLTTASGDQPGFAGSRITRWVDGVTEEFSSPAGHEIALVGDSGTAYVAPSDGGNVYAVDVRNWVTKWTAPFIGMPVMAIAGGGVALHNGETGALAVVDGAGAQRSAAPHELSNSQQALRAGEWIGRTATGTVGASSQSFALGSSSGDLFYLHPSLYSFAANGGNSQGTFAPRRYHQTVQAAAVWALKFYNPYSIRENLEVAGSICRQSIGGQYYANYPSFGFGHSDLVAPMLCESNQSGRWHTHAKFGGGPSSVDLANANGDVNPATGAYRPHFVATPCGWIVKYAGPQASSSMQTLSELTETPSRCTP